MDKKYLDESGLAEVALHVNTRLKTVTSMPASADNGAVRLYVGATTSPWVNGHIYQYNSATQEWIDIAGSKAENVQYNNVLSNLNSTNVNTAINELDSIKLTIVYTMPSSPSNGDIVLFVGTTNTYIQGHFYQYSESSSDWVDITSSVSDADEVSFDPIVSNLVSTNVQDAIDEVVELVDNKVGESYTLPTDPEHGDIIIYTGPSSSLHLTGHAYINEHDTMYYGFKLNNTVVYTVSLVEDTALSVYHTPDYTTAQFTNELSLDSDIVGAEINSDGNLVDQSINIYVRDESLDIHDYWKDVTPTATNIDYDNSTSGLSATKVKGALDELHDSANIAYSNTISGLQASSVQNAIDEVYNIAAQFIDGIVPKGTVAFENLPNLSNVHIGWMYNISNSFVTTSDFIISGVAYSAGSNVYCTNIGTEETPVKKWDVFAVIPGGGGGIPLTKIAPAFSNQTNYNVGEFVTYIDSIYVCTSTHTADDWNTSHFTLLSDVASMLLDNSIVTSTMSKSICRDTRIAVSGTDITLTLSLNATATNMSKKVEVIAVSACTLTYPDSTGISTTDSMSAGTVKILYSCASGFIDTSSNVKATSFTAI